MSESLFWFAAGLRASPASRPLDLQVGTQNMQVTLPNMQVNSQKIT